MAGYARMRRLAVVLVGLVWLAGCGSSTPTSQSSTVQPTPSPTTEVTGKAKASLVDAGFGQDGEYVWVTSIVRNEQDFVGSYVTVSFNLFDAAGTLVKTITQVEAFSVLGQDHIIGTQDSVDPGVVVARVDAALNVQDMVATDPFPELPTTDVVVTANPYGGRTGKFQLTNTLSAPLTAPQVEVACRDGQNKLIGGGYAFPDLIPANGTVLVEVSLITSGDPASCSSFVGAPVDWKAPASSAPSSTPTTVATNAAPTTTADEAFRTWLDQFNAHDWSGQYATMVNAQRAVVTEAAYVACRQADGATPLFTYQSLLGSTDVKDYPIPGTSVRQDGVVLTVQVSLAGVSTSLDAHMFAEDGVWKWTMTQENIANCQG